MRKRKNYSVDYNNPYESYELNRTYNPHNQNNDNYPIENYYKTPTKSNKVVELNLYDKKEFYDTKFKAPKKQNKIYKNEIIQKKSFLDDSEFLAFELYNQIRINKQIENMKIQISKDNSYSIILKYFNLIEKQNNIMNINNLEAFLKMFEVRPISEELELLFKALDKKRKGKLK